MNTRSLRFRLTAWYAGLLGVVFVVFTASTYQLLRHYLEHSLAESLERRSEQIAASLLANVKRTGEAYVADEIKARYAPESYDRFVRVTRGDGSVLYASGRAADFDPTGLAPDAAAEPIRTTLLPDGNKLLITAKAYQAPTGERYLLESGGPTQPIESTLRRLLLLLLTGMPVVAMAAIAGGYFLVRRALAPVVAMAESAEQITLHNLNERLPVKETGDELAHLSLALNRMIDRLREAFEQNRRFLADASHELRTPLTALRGELESVLETAQTAQGRDRIGSALEEVDRLAKIVETLFAISRLEAGEAQRECKSFDLAQMAANAADQMALLAEDKGVAVTCEVENKVTVEGDQARIKQVVVNLLDNAIKYTPSGGKVRLNVRARDEKAIMEVIDTGIGIPAAALPHVFERFFRVDEARSRQIDGAGLGLAIVKSICSAHGGSVEVDSVESHGSRFRVELPLVKQIEKS
jgi:heavy metal sensor kinase